MFVVKNKISQEALNDMFSVAEALSHDIKGAVGTIGSKLSLTLRELERLNEQGAGYHQLVLDVERWKEQIRQIYDHAEDLTNQVREDKINSPLSLSEEITAKLIAPISDMQNGIDNQLKNKRDLVRLKEARTAVFRVNRILEGLLYELREDNALTYRPTNMVTHAQNALDSLYQVRMETEADIIIRGNASMRADQASILVMYINLIENAIKYRRPGQKAEIEIILDNLWLRSLKTSYDDLFDKITGPEEWISVTISDNGIGIPPEERRLVFDMGYRVRTDDNIPGSGYGLARVKTIIRRHRGKYLLETSKKGGLEFICFFPSIQH
ncbi:hypothetical protein BC343_13900 [Mucilaginibacter pedocola]|uniref:histidine kinase n=2 Tax=Mucilaginibacter pedocola TaxID=1792845 RepID=A0A1S9PA58_9SPHI|nr:hypothetical protein BC343_13900 [Mucilaginibacter pedocola]